MFSPVRCRLCKLPVLKLCLVTSAVQKHLGNSFYKGHLGSREKVQLSPFGSHWIPHHKDSISIDKRNETGLSVIIWFSPANIWLCSSILSRILLFLIINDSNNTSSITVSPKGTGIKSILPDISAVPRSTQLKSNIVFHPTVSWFDTVFREMYF